MLSAGQAEMHSPAHAEALCTLLLPWWHTAPYACTALQTLVVVGLSVLFSNAAVVHHHASLSCTGDCWLSMACCCLSPC